MWIGTFNCHHTHSEFSGTNIFEWHHMVVFPRTSVALKMHGHDPLVGSPNVAIFYNHGTEYERDQLTDEGDCCEYFQFSPQLLLEIISLHDPTILKRDEHPFLFTHSFLDKSIFLRQRKLVEELKRPNLTPSLQIDEMAIEVLESLIEYSFTHKVGLTSAKRSTLSEHRHLAFEAQKMLAAQYNRRLNLKQIADALYVSPYHLSRVFRQQTGRPLYQFLEQLRLRNAFERLGDYSNDLTRLALETGYSNHSHFTAAFRRNFGYSPSQWVKNNQRIRA